MVIKRLALEAAQSLVSHVYDLKEIVRRTPKGLTKREAYLIAMQLHLVDMVGRPQFTEYFEPRSTHCESWAVILTSSAKAA